ncbi:hypothetical protein MNBD_DELTA01-1057 [hydrothermal vent metagenome]|uniref:GAF domain-containing protein n=1 Tax=hydrothermal vent metagenome TaxID=652676 RepID=A0A3B0RLM1_9ZZZZ
MNKQGKVFSVTHKFVLLIIFFMMLFVGDIWLLHNKTQGVERFDELNHRLSVLTTDIVRLEYVLDISVITKDYEDKRGGAITTDIANINKSFKDLTRPDYAELFKGEAEFVEVRDSMVADWKAIYSELKRLSKVKTEEELMLIHNVVDMNTFILSESSNRLKEFVQERKNIEFEGRANILLLALAISFLAVFVVMFFFFIKMVLPFERFFGDVITFLQSGARGKMAEDFPGDLGKISHEINVACEKSMKSVLSTDKKLKQLENEVCAKVGKLNALNTVAMMLASSLSQYEIFMVAVSEVLNAVGAEAGMVYLKEGGMLKLKVSKGFSETFFYKGEDVPLSEKYTGEELTKEPVVFKSLDQYPEGNHKDVLLAEGVKSVVSTPILNENNVVGFFDIAFKKEESNMDRHLAFLKAISSNIGVAVGYSELFSREHETSTFLERVIQQIPYGLAVFDVDGLCAMANSAFKNLVGGDVSTDFVGNYNIFNDDEFVRQGLSTFVKNSYNGRIMNFGAEYKSNYLGVDRVASFKVMSFPLYDAAGNIRQVALCFDPVKGI